MGLSKAFATGNVDDSSWRSNQLFSFPAILELQKDLEKICDWVFFRFCNYLVSQSIIEYIDPNVLDYVDWSWKGIDDIDEVAKQNGIRLALENNTKTYKQILGNDWKEQLEQVAEEHEWMRNHGMTHPSDLMISGGQTEASKTSNE